MNQPYTKEQHDQLMAEHMARRAEAARPRVNLSALEPAAKQRVWAFLQQHRPEVAALLRDPHLGELRRRFDALLMIEADLLAGFDHVGP
jgi:hypothetical protein